MTLHVGAFGGGIVLVGSPDAQQTDELQAADALDVGPRGQLVATSDLSDYYTLKDLQGSPVVWSQVYGLGDLVAASQPYIVCVGEGKDAGGVNRHMVAFIERTNAATPIPAGRQFTVTTPVPDGNGVIATIAQQPGIYHALAGDAGFSFTLVCMGAREGFAPNTAPGLYFIVTNAGSTTSVLNSPAVYYALGNGTVAGASSAVPLNFRGVILYNNHAFGWGFDAGASNGDGPARVMFSNLGVPFRWGNDNISTVLNRAFTDSDAIILGDSGEIIRGACKWNGKLFFGTNQQLHYIGGFGRDSFLTDGSTPVARSYNIVGPNAIIEGPDKLLYGVSDLGLWAFDGQVFHPHFKKLVDFAGHSVGYWDCIWTDPTRSLGYPGRTNQDLVWTAVDWDREQVVVGIPWCNATTGAGYGTDTVVLKFHTRTGGFTRQIFLGVTYTAAAYARREGQQREVRVLGTATAGSVSVRRFGYQATPTTAPILPARLPRVTFGPYLPFGSDGQGTVRRAYLTLAWETPASLPLVFAITTHVDATVIDRFTLTVGPVAPAGPAVGDLWLDTSQSDPSLGNGTAGATLPAIGGYLTKAFRGTAFSLVAGSGQTAQRGTVQLPVTRRQGVRWSIDVVCTSAAGRFQIEGLGLAPGAGTANA